MSDDWGSGKSPDQKRAQARRDAALGIRSTDYAGVYDTVYDEELSQNSWRNLSLAETAKPVEQNKKPQRRDPGSLILVGLYLALIPVCYLYFTLIQKDLSVLGVFGPLVLIVLAASNVVALIRDRIFSQR